MRYRTFSLALLAAILGAFAAVGLFDRIVDPFWYFRDVEIAGFNRNKPRAGNFDRLVKPALVAKLAPQAVIVGSSVAAVGLPPTHARFTRNGELRSYNLGLARATWGEVYCLALFAMNHAPVRRLVVGISGIEELDLPVCPADGELGRVDYASMLFSTTAFGAARDTVRLQDSAPSMTREGMWYHARFDGNIRTDDDIARRFALQMREAFCAGARLDATPFVAAMSERAPAAASEGNGLRRLIRIAQRKNVELKLLLYPKHVLLEEVERACRGAADHWNRLWQIVSIADQESNVPSPSVEVWDFYGYHPLNGERVHAGKAMRDRGWQDGGHFNEQIGAAVFDSMFAGKAGYGARVTPQTFARQVPEVEAQRNAFRAANTWVDDELAEIAGMLPLLPPPGAR